MEFVLPFIKFAKVIILQDSYTANLAEEFIYLAQTQTNVVNVGRVTSGDFDFLNPVNIVIGDIFVLTYPMSIRADVYEGK